MVILTESPVSPRVWELFAQLLDYPREVPLETLAECRILIAEISEDAAAGLGGFEAFVGGVSVGHLQEQYTRSFDMDESNSLYVGYHLLGESYKRSALLLELKVRYRTQGVEVAGELADHLPVVLRFLGVCEDRELAHEIIVEAVRPMLEIMAGKREKASDTAEADRPPSVPGPYDAVLAALLDVVRAVPVSEPQPLVITGAAGWPTM